jgi:hypothetical protein
MHSAGQFMITVKSNHAVLAQAKIMWLWAIDHLQNTSFCIVATIKKVGFEKVAYGSNRNPTIKGVYQ